MRSIKVILYMFSNYKQFNYIEKAKNKTDKDRQNEF